jgi:hypothetical protein
LSGFLVLVGLISKMIGAAAQNRQNLPESQRRKSSNQDSTSKKESGMSEAAVNTVSTPAAMPLSPQEHPNQFALLKQRRFAPFFWTQFSGAANDNLFKLSLIHI